MVTRRRIAVLIAVALLDGCRATPAPVVEAERYDAFWLWAGVKPQPVLARAKRLYILEGEVTARESERLSSLRPAVPRLPRRDLWLVVRVETLRWSPAIYDDLLSRLTAWRRAGNSVTGIQIDFDARTRHLDDYASFLADLRRRLPGETKLSITGLLDWSANGEPEKLKALAGVVDEIVLQTYQGRRTIPGYETYLSKLDGFPILFRIGLVQHGEWTEPEALRGNPRFGGYVVFLLNPEDAGRDLRH